MHNTSAFTKTILIVDNDTCWAKIAASIFQTADFTTHIAANCTAAISFLQTTIPDCVLLDYHMPDQNGDFVAEYIRNDEKLKTTPLIMMSGDETLAKTAHYACKADSFVVKTNDMFGMLYTVEGLLRLVNQEREIQICGDIRLDGRNLTVQRKTGKLITLTREQFSLLALLVEKSPAFVDDFTIAKLILKADEDKGEDNRNALCCLAHRLRKQLGTQLRVRIKRHSKDGWAYVLPEKLQRAQNTARKNANNP